MSLKDRITQDVKDAMRARDKPRLATLRLITAAIKQREVDERIELDDTQVTLVLDKMVKQRRESIVQFEKAGILSEVRSREFYEKPTQERKRKKAAAVKRTQKKVSRELARRVRLY